ncbi:MAG: GDP-mannose 4,6-dehydratase [Pseudomonadota bacterium]|nr:GDP-mannose 4,6-dehydratase [Pseudomonadota bacterium]
MSKRVLVTGSEGFTGRYLVDELKRAGHVVTGLGSHASEEPGYLQADLTDADALRSALVKAQPDVVIHLAALAYVGHGDANAFYRVNLMGTRNLLEAIIASGKTPESVLLASSANVYGNQAEGELSELTSPAPANDYAVSKLAMEYMAKTWLPKLPITLVRPFNYTGVGQTENFLLPKIVSHFKRRAPVIELGNLDVWRDFSDVRAVVEAYRRLVDRKPVGETFNVASGKTHSLREVLALCAELSGHQIDVQVNPAFVRANEVKTLCGNASKLRECIGEWKTPELKETLRWMLEANS